MNRYAVHYPRDFANEYTVYVGSKETLDRLRDILESRRNPGSLHPITRRRAIRLGVSRPKEATRYSEQWFGGFAETGTRYATDLTSILADAHAATLNMVDHGYQH